MAIKQMLLYQYKNISITNFNINTKRQVKGDMAPQLERICINIPLGSTGNESILHFECVFIQPDVIVYSSSIQTYKDFFSWNEFIKNYISHA